MKKIIFMLMFLVSTAVMAEADPITGVFGNFNCLVCHSIDHKIVGPSFKDIATKYKGVPSAEDTLIKKVSLGGKGVWGDMPMPANDQSLSKQVDIRRLVQYILRLAK